MSEPLLRVRDLRVSFRTEGGLVEAVDGVSFDLGRGEMLAIVGESGSGKTVTALTVMGLSRGRNSEIAGSVVYGGIDLVTASDDQLRDIRASKIAMIFQDPMTSLNPVYRVGDQIVEQIRAHELLSKSQARARAIDALGSVGIPEPTRRYESYPHEFSGGMRQRAMIAMALSLEPEILIADEPTTALDVTIQAQIMKLLEQLNEQRELAVVLITHDLGVVAEATDRALVMYAGQVVEQGTINEIFYDPLHPYSWGLLGSLARLDRPRPPRLASIPGAQPSLIAPAQGCRFMPRCPHAFDRCGAVTSLEARAGDPGHLDRCFLPRERKRTLRLIGDGIGLEAEAG